MGVLRGLDGFEVLVRVDASVGGILVKRIQRNAPDL